MAARAGHPAVTAGPAPVRVVALTREAVRRLGRSSRGRVHSVFAGAVDVVLDGLGPGGWLSLHGPGGAIPSPFGIVCERLTPDAAWLGARAAVGADGLLRVGGALAVALAGAPERDTTLPREAPMPAVAACLARAGRGTAGGLLGVVARCLGQGRPLATPPPPRALARHAGRALDRLAAATASGDHVAWGAAARGLLGLGPGLTPSGDDVLLGALAGAAVAGSRGRALVRGVGPALLRDARTRTGPWSRAFLAAALVGAVAEPVLRFVVCPAPRPLAGLLATGATSGADVLAGYLLARVALAADRRDGRRGRPGLPCRPAVSRPSRGDATGGLLAPVRAAERDPAPAPRPGVQRAASVMRPARKSSTYGMCPGSGFQATDRLRP